MVDSEVKIRFTTSTGILKIFVYKFDRAQKKHSQLMSNGSWREVGLYEDAPDDSFTISQATLNDVLTSLNLTGAPA